MNEDIEHLFHEINRNMFLAYEYEKVHSGKRNETNKYIDIANKLLVELKEKCNQIVKKKEVPK